MPRLLVLTGHKLHQAQSNQALPAARRHWRLKRQLRHGAAAGRAAARGTQAGAHLGQGLLAIGLQIGAALRRGHQRRQLLHLGQLSGSSRQPGAGVGQPGAELTRAGAAGAAQHGL